MHYRPLLVLSSGGMGVVSLAARVEGSFVRLVAMKRLRAEHRGEEDVERMFIDEARLAGLVRHPNVVSVLDVGNDEDGPYLIMDFVDGMALSDILLDAARAGELLPVALVCAVLAQAARGLHAAHELVGADGARLEVVHRDVSPQNILVGFDGVVRVTDFGVARALGRATRTDTGVVKGKVGYLPPEVLLGLPADRRGDLYSFGVVLAEALTASRLFSDSDPLALEDRARSQAPDFAELRPDVQDELVALGFRLLSPDPAQRPSSAQEVARILEQLARDDEVPELDRWMQERFGERRVGLQQRIAGALRAARPDHAPRAAADKASAARRSRRLSRGLALLFVLLASAALGLWWGFAGS